MNNQITQNMVSAAAKGGQTLANLTPTQREELRVKTEKLKGIKKTLATQNFLNQIK